MAQNKSETDDGMPPIDFTTFVLSMSTSCMVLLGEIDSPEGGRQTDLAMAKHNIEILEMLAIKTEGNLSGEEERLLDQVLVDLRNAFKRKGG
jgi:hypothetical protein